MEIQKIIELVSSRNAKRIVLLCHINADPDSICSAFAFARLLQTLKPTINIEIAAVQGPSKLSRFLMNLLPLELTEHPNIETADVIILIDTNTIQQLGDWSERIMASNAALVVIDHHVDHLETEQIVALKVMDETVSSTCEIIYNLYEEAQVNLGQAEAKALFLGIAFDTRHFMLAHSHTFEVIADLTRTGINTEELLSLLSLPMESSERVARLTASSRIRLSKINEWLIVFSIVSAYQASAARALIDLGAHVAIVAGRNGERIQLSMRASRDFHEKTSVHLGKDIATPLGEYLKGTGGGHPTAAGVNGFGDVRASFDRCLNLLKNKLK